MKLSVPFRLFIGCLVNSNSGWYRSKLHKLTVHCAVFLQLSILHNSIFQQSNAICLLTLISRHNTKKQHNYIILPKKGRKVKSGSCSKFRISSSFGPFCIKEKHIKGSFFCLDRNLLVSKKKKKSKSQYQNGSYKQILC